MASLSKTSKTTKLMPPSSQPLLITLLAALLLTFCFFFTLNHSPHFYVHAHLPSADSSTPRRPGSFSVPLTGPPGFVGPHCTISCRISGINSKDHPTITTRGLISQVDHGTALKKRVQERASFVRSINSKQEARGGAGALMHGEGRMNVEKEKYHKQLPQMHRFGRRLLHSSKGSLVAVSLASGPVSPSEPSPCTHIPKGEGHC